VPLRTKKLGRPSPRSSRRVWARRQSISWSLWKERGQPHAGRWRGPSSRTPTHRPDRPRSERFPDG
jgi:hypothetical protein